MSTPVRTRLVLASGNAGKLAEFRMLLDGTGIEAVPQGEFGIPDADETATTFVENALLKARQATAMSGLPALADDSGLCVDALGGAPGLYSARYAGSHGNEAANRAKLLDAIRDLPAEQRGAHFHCAIVLLRSPQDPAPLICEGIWHGRILTAERGDGGFGYDTLFLDPHSGLSAGEMPAAAKHRVSHRGQAMALLLAALQQGRLRG